MQIMKNSFGLILLLFISLYTFSCKKKEKNETTVVEPKLIFKMKFDSTQVRLDNLGNVSTVPNNHRTQSPRFNFMSAHYIEMAPNDLTAVGGGVVLYKASEVTTGITTGSFTTAIDFDKSTKVKNGEVFYSVPLKNVSAGNYKWLRVSLAYQNYDITYRLTYGGNSYLLNGTIASFVGYNTYLNSYTIKNQSIAVNANKLQGYWGFESESILGYTPAALSGQAPAGSTTVVNPLFASSPIPAGSCLATGKFVNANGNPQELVITGKETSDIVIEVSLSTNNSLEWVEHSGDNYFEPGAGDTITDMGIRGMIPYIK